MSKCEGCQFWYESDKDVGQWVCNDPVSWCNPETGEEVCRYWQGAVQREPQPQDNAEAGKPTHNNDYAAALRVLKEFTGGQDLASYDLDMLDLWVNKRLNSEEPNCT